MSVLERVLAGVVEIRAGGRSCGAGVVFERWQSRRVIVTNAHVVAGQERVSITTAAGVPVGAYVVRRDAERDIALLELERPVAGLVPARAGDPRTLRPGHVVVAVGHPAGFRHAVTTGVVHAVGPLRSVIGLPPRIARLPWIQADVRLAPGNSGGPLCDAEGRVLGINTMVVAGLGLAVPVTAIGSLLEAAA